MAFSFDFSAMLAAAAAVSTVPAPLINAAPAPIRLSKTSDRMACRAEKMTALMESAGPTAKDAVATRWTLATCAACGICSDLARR